MPSGSTSSIQWVISALRKPFYLWNVGSCITVAAVGLCSKLLIDFLNFPVCHNKCILTKLLEESPSKRPLITLSNHHSCIDDPAIWGCLKLGILCNAYKMRWSLAADNICFTNKIHSYFFMLGKCIPVVRGIGVNQEGIDLCIEKLQQGDWVHIFPEGRVNMTKEYLRLKWGIGRMIYESSPTPIVLPIWHIGMDEILPNNPPYILRVGKNITINFGQPIDLSNLKTELKAKSTPPKLARKIITDGIQSEFMKLKYETEILHKQSLR